MGWYFCFWVDGWCGLINELAGHLGGLRYCCFWVAGWCGLVDELASHLGGWIGCIFHVPPWFQSIRMLRQLLLHTIVWSIVHIVNHLFTSLLGQPIDRVHHTAHVSCITHVYGQRTWLWLSKVSSQVYYTTESIPQSHLGCSTKPACLHSGPPATSTMPVQSNGAQSSRGSLS